MRRTQGFETGIADGTVPSKCARCGASVLEERCRMRRLVEVYEKRQQSVAERMHDRLAQRLFGALLHLQAFENLDGNSDASVRALATTKEALDDVIGEARRLVSELRPPIFDEFCIGSGITHQICGMDEVPDREIEYLHPDGVTNVSSQLEVAVFRITEELLSNAYRHSQAAKIRVELAHEGDRLRVEVRDCGIGFDPRQTDGNCTGLQSVHDRAALFGGRAVVDAAPGKGTRVLVELPPEHNGAT